MLETNYHVKIRVYLGTLTLSSYIEIVKQSDLQVEDVDVIVDDHNPGIIDIDPNPDIGNDTQLCFSIESLNLFHCNICKNMYDQDGNQMNDIILLEENIWITSWTKTTIFQLQSLNHSFLY